MWVSGYVCFRQVGRDGRLSMPSLGCSCLLTSLPQDSWEQLQGPREREGGGLRSLNQTFKSLYFSLSLVFVSLFVPVFSLWSNHNLFLGKQTETQTLRSLALGPHTHAAKNTAWGVDCSHTCGRVSLRCTQPTRITFYSFSLARTHAHIIQHAVYLRYMHTCTEHLRRTVARHLWSK